MKNQEKITELQKYIDTSGIEEGIETLQEKLGEYIRWEKMKNQKKEIRIGYLEIIEAIWKMEEALKFITEESKKWEKASDAKIFFLKR